MQLAGKQPVVIDVDSFALQNCYEVNYQPDASQVVTLLNIGASTMNVNIVKGTTSLSAGHHVGGSSSRTSSNEALDQLQQLEAVKRGANPAVEGLEEKAIEPLMIRHRDRRDGDRRRSTSIGRRRKTIRRSSKDPNLGGGSKLNGGTRSVCPPRAAVEVLEPFRSIK